MLPVSLCSYRLYSIACLCRLLWCGFVRTLRPSPGQSVRCHADRRRSWDITHHRSGCAVRRGRGQAVALHRGFAPFRNLAAPRHALRWPCVGGCEWKIPPRPVWARLLASFDPFASNAHALGATGGGPMLQAFGAAPGPCHPHAARAAAICFWPVVARTTRRACPRPQGGTLRKCSATARRPSRW